MRPAQDPVIPLLVGGLIAVSIVAALSILVWIWAMRRPAHAKETGAAGAEQTPLLYVAIGGQFGLGFDNDADGGRNWVEMLREKMPAGTRLVTLGRRGVTLAELNRVEIPEAVQLRPDVITLWSAVTDSTRSVALADYTHELHTALSALSRGTSATILLLNLPDISLVASGVSDDRRALIRGGAAQWNREIAAVATRYGKRAYLVDLFPSSEKLFGTKGESSPDADSTSDRNLLLAELIWSTIERQGGQRAS